MQETIINIINQFGYVGVSLLIMIENVFPPIPSEVILTFGGFLTTYTELNVWGVIAAATIGSASGAVILYACGRALSVNRLERLIDSKLGRLLHLKTGDIQKAGKWFAKHGNRAVFFCRFVPIVRSLISIPAGSAKMKVFPFLALTVTGTFIWNVVLVFLGRMMGSAWETAAHYFDIYAVIAMAALGLIAAVVAAVYVKRRFFNN